tara:strand:- start:5971 stop:7056 length:1086 start_codon:yes stop_codon:yes gene_type:complete
MYTLDTRSRVPNQFQDMIGLNRLDEPNSLGYLLDNRFTPDNIRSYAVEDDLEKFEYPIENSDSVLYFYDRVEPDHRLIEKIIFRVNSLSHENWNGKLEIHIYPSDFKKEFPLELGDTLDVENINSGVSTSYGNTGFKKIVIYRNEEMMKVLVHELLHAYGYGDPDYENFNYNRILDVSFDYNLLLNEAFIEFNAVIYNTYLMILERNAVIPEDGNPSFDRNAELLFEQMIKQEIMYSINKVAQILKFFDYKTFEEFQSPNKNNKYKFREKTSVISYFIVKLFILNNYKRYIYFYQMSDNNNDIYNILGDPEDEIIPMNLFNQPELINEINNRMTMSDINNLSVNNLALEPPNNSLRMSLFG